MFDKMGVDNGEQKHSPSILPNSASGIQSGIYVSDRAFFCIVPAGHAKPRRGKKHIHCVYKPPDGRLRPRDWRDLSSRWYAESSSIEQTPSQRRIFYGFCWLSDGKHTMTDTIITMPNGSMWRPSSSTDVVKCATCENLVDTPEEVASYPDGNCPSCGEGWTGAEVRSTTIIVTAPVQITGGTF
jgi:hypothetical protein